MGDLEVGIADGIAVLTINRVAQNNTVGGSLLGDLLRAARELERDDKVRVVVTAASGPIWCASADYDDLAFNAELSADELLAGDHFAGEKGLPQLSPNARRFDRLGLGRWVLGFLELQKPTIAAITGPAAAGGLSLALLHDIRYAAQGARFRSGFVQWGLGPEMGLSVTLPNAVGINAATDILLADKKLTAAEALECGLVHRVLELENVLPAALEYASRIAALPPLGVRATVRALRRVAHRSMVEQLELEWDNQRITIGSDDFVAATRSFVEARRARSTKA